MIYKKLKEIHNLILFGIHDEYRKADGTPTDNSLIKTQQTRDLTPYITTYESDVVNSKIVRFNLNNCYNNKRLPDNSYIYINSFTLPILNDGDSQYFTNLKLITGGDLTKDYNNLSNDNPILATIYNTSTIAYDPELPISSTTTYVIDDEEDLMPQITTYSTYTTINTDRGSTTTITKTETAVSNYTDYLDVEVNTNNVDPAKIQYKNDWYFQVDNTDQTNVITTNQDILCDILLVGAGGYGGLGAYSGGGGGGEIVSVSDYYMPRGVYNIDVRSLANDGSVSVSYNNNQILKAKKGGDGGYQNVLPTSGGSGGGGGANINTIPSNSYFTISPSVSVNTISGINDIYYSFTSTSGTYTFTPSNNCICDILIIGGGGSGGRRHAGGGGAGAVIHLQNQSLNAGNYTIKIGSGGASIPSSSDWLGMNGNNGQDSYISYNSTNIYLAKGGGGGGQSSAGLAGGSSGGGPVHISVDYTLPVLTTNIPSGAYGNIGGKGLMSGNYYIAAGGGGAGSVGGDAVSITGGIGGTGTSISITGSSVFYGGGGGGGSGNGILQLTYAGSGGAGGGGAGAVLTTSATNGTANTGGGGGGSGFSGANNGASGAGGSGIVIIRVKNVFQQQTGATAGIPYQTNLTNTMYIEGDVNDGSNAIQTQGGNGGQATNRNYNTTGTVIEYAKSGIGATNVSTPTTKTVYGEGGDGNGGLPMTGTVIMRFKDIGIATETSSSAVVVNQPFSITYNNDYINTDEILLNSYKVPSNLLSKGYLDFEISSLKSGGNVRFIKEELDKLLINATIFSL